MKKILIPTTILIIAIISFLAITFSNNNTESDKTELAGNTTVTPDTKATLMPSSTTPAPTKTATATNIPTLIPTATIMPTNAPTLVPTPVPTLAPTIVPTKAPTLVPAKTTKPTVKPTTKPTVAPTKKPVGGDDPFTLYLGKGGYTKPSVYGPYLNAEQLQVVKKHQEEFKKKYIKDSMTDYEKVRIIHDYLATNIVYRHWIYDYANSAYGVFEYGGGACSGFARAFKALCDVCDIPCYYVHTEGDDNHQWNYVKIDGKWYETDLTISVGCGNDGGFLLGGDIDTVKGAPTLSSTSYHTVEDYNKAIKASIERQLKENNLTYIYDGNDDDYEYEFTEYIEFETYYKGDLGMRHIDDIVNNLITETQDYIKANPCAPNQEYIVSVSLEGHKSTHTLKYYRIYFYLFLYDKEGYFLDEQIIMDNMLQGAQEASTATFILEPKLAKEYAQYLEDSTSNGIYYRYEDLELSGDYDAVLKALRNTTGEHFKGYDDSAAFYVSAYIHDAYVYNGELYLNVALLENYASDYTKD